jgi:APA family basic amino acid/polyamine antiporter
VLTVATVMTWALVAINYVGVRAGARVQDATVIAKLLVLGALVAVAVVVAMGHRVLGGETVLHGASLAPLGMAAPTTFSALFAGVTLTMFAYGGWQQVLWVAGEVKEARRTVPLAILIGVGIVIVAYLTANWAYLRLLGYDGLCNAKAIAAQAFSVVSPERGRRIAAGAVAVSAFGVLNAQFLSGPRLTWAMARDGQFFAGFARLHSRFATPTAAILLLGVLASALTLGLGLDRTDLLTTGVVVVDATFFALTGLLRRRTPPGERGPRWLDGAAIAFAILELLAVAGSVLEKDARVVALTGLAWIGAAALTWLVFFRKPSVPA